MSRSGAKAGGKDRDRPRPTPPAQPAVITPDIVPGRFSENDWTAMLERDNAVDFVIDFIEEVLARTMESIHKLHVMRQLVPFTVLYALTEVLHVIEWKFLERDEGEGNVNESGWIQDEEPNAAVLDSWAQGAVPITEVITSYLIQDEGETSQLMEKKTEKVVGITRETDIGDKVPDAGASQEEEKAASKKKPKPKNSISKKKSKAVPPPLQVTESLELPPRKSLIIKNTVSKRMSSCRSVQLLTKRHSPQNKVKRMSHYSDVTIDERGNIVSVMKMDADALPTNRTSVKYHIVDPNLDEERSGVLTARHGLNLTHYRRRSPMLRHAESASIERLLTKTRKYVPLECPPSLLESIKVSPGVTVSERGRTKKLTKRSVKVKEDLEHHLMALQPISVALRDRSNTISVSDLLDRSSPVIRPLDETKPLPPIMRASSTNGANDMYHMDL